MIINFSEPNMGPGIFYGTYYIVQEPLNVETLSICLNPIQKALVDQILTTECMDHLKIGVWCYW